MKWFICPMATLCLLWTTGLASAAEPPPDCASWWAYLKECCTGYTRPHCVCADDYCWKPLPPVCCRYCPKGCDTYDWKPLPPVFCRWCPKGCDTYDWKPYPCISSTCRPWYTCGTPPICRQLTNGSDR